MNTVFAKGSEWRKWDLHVHTPASLLNNGFGSNWDRYVVKLFQTLIARQVAAVGITDYFTIDGYKKIKSDYLENEEKLRSLFAEEEITKLKAILVLPNIELRSNIFVGPNSVNFHVIFSEEVSVKDIEEKFLHEIDFVYQGEPQTEDRKRKLKEANLRELGAELKSQHSEFSESDLYVGMMNAVVDDKQVSKILYDKDATFGGRYLFGVMADEDLSNIGWNSRDHLTRKVLLQKSDFLFSSNKNTRNWALGKPPYREGVNKFLAEFKTLKPCVHGSDAHEDKYIAYPCAKRGDAAHDCATDAATCDLRNCWIKADGTFEGLKQVLYEPADRIAIQSADPTPLKSSQTITQLSIAAADLDPELKIADTMLSLNEGLVAVTGGKSGGKTALVDLIANIYEDRAFSDDKNSFVKRVAEGNPSLQATIVLQDGQAQTKDIREPVFIEGASVVYVAQGELEKHVEDPAHLETYINRLIFDSNEIKDSELRFDYENINEDVSSLNARLEQINNAIILLEIDTAPHIEDDLKKEGKKLATDLQDVEKKGRGTGQGPQPREGRRSGVEAKRAYEVAGQESSAQRPRSHDQRDADICGYSDSIIQSVDLNN